MKLVNFKAGEQIRLGIKTEAGVIDVEKEAAAYKLDVPVSVEEVIVQGEAGLTKLAKLLTLNATPIREDDITFAPCVTRPEKILCVGLNYKSHVAESKMELPKSPVLFSKFNNALAAHKQVIAIPEATRQCDYEVELVLVIGKEAVNVSREEALSYVFGYTVGNDLSARDLQFRSGQWLLGKTCDNFAPVGPYLVTADEVDPFNLEITCTINGEIRQSSNTKNMIFDCATIISYISQHMTLKPGDIIFSGTPEGVILGYPEDQRQWLKSGDKIVSSVETIGTLVNELK